MSIFFLIRHGLNDMVGKRLAGTMLGVHLNEEGRAQAEELAERIGGLPIDAVYSSPLERTLETARPLAARLGLEVHTREEFREVEIGGWTGLGIEELVKDPDWKIYNIFRIGTRPAGGELSIEVQQRMVTGIESLRMEYPDGKIVVVSHADPIKCVLAHYMGMPLDFMLRLEISLVSVSIVSINDYGAKVLCTNCLGKIPEFFLSL